MKIGNSRPGVGRAALNILEVLTICAGERGPLIQESRGQHRDGNDHQGASECQLCPPQPEDLASTGGLYTAGAGYLQKLAPIQAETSGPTPSVRLG